MPTWLFDALKDNPAVKALDAQKKKLPLTSLMQEALTIAASYQKEPRGILVIKQNLYQAQRLYERLITLLSEDQCALFGADESLRVASIAASPEMTAMKVATLSSLLNNPNQIVVTCPSGITRFLPQPELFRSGCLTLEKDQTMDMQELKERLLSGGYQQVSHIDHPLTFAQRGGIIDVFSINHDQPIRIEFFDDEIESIRYFDIVSQKTVQEVSACDIVPASDILFSKEDIEVIKEKAEELLKDQDNVFLRGEIETDIDALENNLIDQHMYLYMSLLEKPAGVFDYMHHPLMIFSDEEIIMENYQKLQKETTSYIQELVQEGKALPKYTMWHDLYRLSPTSKRIQEDPFENNIAKIEEIHMPNELLAVKLHLIQSDRCAVLALTDKEMARVIETCVEESIPYHLVQDTLQEGINLYVDDIAQGFYLVEEDIHVYTANELFEIHRHTGRFEKKFNQAEVIHGYDELEKGDYVVHAQYGVGQFVGIETRELQKAKRDFLKIIYRGNAELLVPLEQFRLVRKFVSREGVVPKLNKLGTDEWEKTKKRIEESVNDIAERLITLYASREQRIGHAFAKDNELTKKFEDAFLFELTPDQRQAVEDVKKDMEDDKPMDRLICGDVGFGKTEVAIRASFKAVSDNKQVAVLCPTTILCEQHFKTFSSRYEDFPVTIKRLDRFVSKAEQKKTLEELKEGKIDILIGTHRLLSKDVVFQDLGLLVVDEEQRFGVEHKERIKELKNGVDVLALSATPIPRTLQMSLVGIRQLSQLETPPQDRYSVQTYVAEKNDGLVTDAIQKELARGGQVFYLFNNIEHIYNVTRKLQQQLPEATFGVVHGKMNREDIEDAMMRFTEGKIDVMVCTTIIENGIDIPNVNTILLDNAQDFGLAQIYQIKGRVGRSNRLAYAYLLVPQRKQLSEVAQKRLQAVKEFARLGSGYKIAMRDLTIRGAGDLLGPQQSGFIDTVGIDMYIEMLEEAIQRQKNPNMKKKEEIKHTNINKTGYIPTDFAPDDFDKLDLYQKIDQLVTKKELKDFRRDIIDQYGKLPQEVETLFLKKEIDIILHRKEAESFKEVSGQYEITFSPAYSDTLDGIKLFEMMGKISKDIELRYKNQRIIVRLPRDKDELKLAIEVMQKTKEARRDES